MLQDFTVELSKTPPIMPELSSPIVTVVLSNILSYNEVLYLPPLARAGIIKKERNRGYKIGLEIAKLLKIDVKPIKIFKNKKDIHGYFISKAVKPITEKKIFCILSVWREQGKKDPTKGNRKRDVYNAAIKALIDGLTDAGVWLDDNETFHSDFWVSYKGVSPQSRFELSFYECPLTDTVLE